MAAKMGEDMRVQYAWVCEGGLARPRDKDKPLLVDVAETAPASWWKRMSPCGVCGTDRVGQCVWGRQEHAIGGGSWVEVTGQCMWDGQGHAIGDGCCGEVLGQCMCDRHMQLVMEVVERLLGRCGADKVHHW